ncbi:MAG: hypothetical protein J6A56_00445 [Clostridia bacterium]|nr:hypothetical protein [Clostridia bacterium]
MGRKNKELTQEKATVRERIADAIDISKEVVLDTVLISCIGDRELTLENYKSILTYSDVCIQVKANPYPLTITGSGLEIRNITRELLYITGRIHAVEFNREKGRA